MCKGGWLRDSVDWGIVPSTLHIGLPRKVTIPPSRLRRATSLYTREAFTAYYE